MLGWHVLTFCVFGIVHWREAYERIFWWEGPKDSGQRTPRVVGSCNLNQWRRSWEKWLQSETIEQRRTRCPILSNSVMTGWQGNRWLARSPRFCRTKSPKKRFLEDRTAPAANVNKGGRDALPAKRKTLFQKMTVLRKLLFGVIWGGQVSTFVWQIPFSCPQNIFIASSLAFFQACHRRWVTFCAD